MKLPRLLALACFAVATLHAADPTPPDPAARLAAVKKLADSLKYQTGVITLRDGVATISLPPGYRYLNPADASTVLHQIWGNPGSSGSLGLLVPAAFDPLVEGEWAVVISFEEDGYVKDDDASTIKYDKLLAEMKEGVNEASKERVKEGYPSIELVGWASPPHYDQAAHKLYWAKEIKFGDSPEHTLNYNLRLLGRRGVLVLNAVAAMSDLKKVEAATPAILGMVNFQEGHRYADFTPSSDKVATYGIAALVAGGIAAKAGFFKLLWVGILAFKKIIIIAVIACAGFLKKFFNRGGAKEAEALRAPTPPPSA